MRRPSYNSSKHGSTKILDCQRKSVRFAVATDGNILTKSYLAKHYLEESLWLNQEEWKQIRRSGQNVVDSVQKGDFIWSEARRHSYIKTMTKLWRTCVKGKHISDSMKEELIFWTSIGHSRRGLEKFSVTEVQEERQRRRREHIEGIMFVQDQCWDHEINVDQTARLLRVASEKLSQVATQFAAILADADASAVSDNAAEERLAQRTLANKLCSTLDDRARTPRSGGEPRDQKWVANAAA